MTWVDTAPRQIIGEFVLISNRLNKESKMATAEPNALRLSKRGTPLGYFLMFVFVLFIAILAMVYLITRQSRPVMLDEHGKPLASSCQYPGDQVGGASVV